MAAPAWMHPDEPSLADSARIRLQKLHKTRTVQVSATPDATKRDAPDMSQDMDEPILVDFKDTREYGNDDNRDYDIFRWAILYENQRGLTIFSTPYYSSRSLLPHDPRPFTVPDPGPSSPSSQMHKAPPNVTPATYTLPDPTWRWVSKAWLIDMRGDGDVQEDGFEYNWLFRRTHWRARVGWLSAGGFVRRRRWIRLMMRPSDARRKAEAAFEDRAHADAVRPVHQEKELQPLVWKGDADDWTRVHAALKDHTRDGPRLELWVEWLSDFGAAPIRTRPRAWTEDDVDADIHPTAEQPDTSIPEVQEHPLREWVLAVLRSHAPDIFNLFIYPDSRAELREMFLRAGLAQDIFIGTPASRQLLGPVDFWSRTSELDLLAVDSAQEKHPV